MKRFEPKTLLLLCLPALVLAGLAIWIVPIFTRPLQLISHKIECGNGPQGKGIWHTAHFVYPIGLREFLQRRGSNRPNPMIHAYDAQGNWIAGFSMGEINDPQGEASSGVFYTFDKFQKQKGPFRFTLETDSEFEDWKRQFPEIKVEYQDLPRQIGQKITAK